MSDDLYRAFRASPSVWPHVTEGVWARWLDIWATDPGRWSEDPSIFAVVPEELAVQALRDGRIGPYCSEIRNLLWGRMPDRLLALVDELAAADPVELPEWSGKGTPLSSLVFGAPEDRVESLVERAAQWTRDPPSHPPGAGGWVQNWLVRVVERRQPGWRKAFRLLAGSRRQQ